MIQSPRTNRYVDALRAAGGERVCAQWGASAPAATTVATGLAVEFHVDSRFDDALVPEARWSGRTNTNVSPSSDIELVLEENLVARVPMSPRARLDWREADLADVHHRLQADPTEEIGP